MAQAKTKSQPEIIGTIDPNESIQDVYRAQKIIKISERLTNKWALSGSYIQQFCYDYTQDRLVPLNQNMLAAFTSFWDYDQNKYEVLELLDDGMHFDNIASDKIYGNYRIGNINEFKTDESIIDVLFDSIGIQTHAYYNTVNFIPSIPRILSPWHQSTVASTSPFVQWTIDTNSDICGIILFDQEPILGKRFGDILWQKNYEITSKTVFGDSIPISLDNKKEYHLIIWSYVKTKFTNGNWNGEAFSMEWSTFTIDVTVQIQERLNLVQNYPNPFNDFTIIAWSQKTENRIILTVYNMLGKEVKQLMNDVMPAGQNFMSWDGTNSHRQKVPSGIYILNARIGDCQQSIKLTFLYN
jgi:hypothetical protein